MGGALAFRGAVAVGRPLVGGPVATTTLPALELWDDSLVATLVEFPEPGAVSAGIQAGGANTWSATSDAGSIHRGVGGGGPAGADRLIDWRLTLTPGLPPAVRTVDVRIGIGDDDAARDADPDCMSCGPPLPPSPPLPPVEQLPVAPGLELDWFGSRLVVPALVRWPGWFDLTVVGERRGAWGDAPFAAPVGGSRWAAVDDRGRHYDGAATGTGSDGRLVHRDLSFAPALAPDARTLTLLVPISYDGWARRVTIEL